MTKKHRNGEIWEFEREMSGGAEGGGVGDVILGIDGGTTSTICVCVPFLPPQSLQFPDPIPLLARVEAGCSNHNSVGGTLSLSLSLSLSVLVPLRFSIGSAHVSHCSSRTRGVCLEFCLEVSLKSLLKHWIVEQCPKSIKFNHHFSY